MSLSGGGAARLSAVLAADCMPACSTHALLPFTAACRLRLVSLAAQRFIAQVVWGGRSLFGSAVAEGFLLPASTHGKVRRLFGQGKHTRSLSSAQVLEEAHNAHKLRQMAPAAKLKEQVGGCGAELGAARQGGMQPQPAQARSLPPLRAALASAVRLAMLRAALGSQAALLFNSILVAAGL